jgi:hypothetical protein
MLLPSIELRVDAQAFDAIPNDFTQLFLGYFPVYFHAPPDVFIPRNGESAFLMDEVRRPALLAIISAPAFTMHGKGFIREIVSVFSSPVFIRRIDCARYRPHCRIQKRIRNGRA